AIRPHTAPVAVETALSFLFSTQLKSIQTSAPAAPAVLVTTKALAARGEAARALPALKPSQPNQRTPAPRRIRGRLRAVRPAPALTPWRCHIIRAADRPAKPALACTTAPPAKSRAPSLCNQPPAPQTQWAIGS